LDLQGKRVVVTGAASGIGAALVDALRRVDGVRLLAVDLADVPEEPGRLWFRRVDLSDAAALDALVEEADALLGGPVDVFFANAGYAWYGRLPGPDMAKLERLFRTNTLGPIHVLQRLLARRPAEDFRVVVTASAMAFLPVPGYAAYAATKATLRAFAVAVRVELKRPETFTLVYPIATRTHFFEHGKTTAPTPWPSQTPEQVARAMIRGVQRDRADIHPSLVFRVFSRVADVLPFTGWLYQVWQAWLLERWLRAQR
jgi:NAD(P)-dependent dehydrogenase (short-subunit alcohol dehydrogenase family)